MRLKRLELSGFKSFVDPTKIDLDQGITAIVGPNGCGKSNIVDALRWVLGEHSARHLRGGVMDDLIFQGSEGRSPVAICDVELTFAVEKGRLSPPYHELEEIRIRRRLTREGGSDAFINGKMVRIKDIIDLFLDTGISTRAYAIVEQGSIARMVTAKPEERRIIFEEAAGVMKYRSRRRESERRMKDTRQNLDRVLDLLDEVKSQCRSLKQQASRAERFKKMQDEFTRTRAISFALRYRDLQQQQQQSAAQLAEAQHEEQVATLQLSHAEKAVTQARDRALTHEQEAESVQDRLRNAERHRSDLQQEAERLSGERRLLNERREMLENRIVETEGRRRHVVDDLAQIEQELGAQDSAPLQKRRDEAAERVTRELAAVQSERTTRDQLLTELERLRQSHEQASKQQQQAAQACSRLDARLQQLQQRQNDLNRRLQQQRDAAKVAAQQLTDAASQRRQSSEALESAQQALEQCRNQRAQASAHLNHTEATLREWRGECQELRARSRNQDISDALRQSLRNLGGLWIDELLHVPEGLEAAVAALLRGRSGAICLPADADLDAWRQAVGGEQAAAIGLFRGPADAPNPPRPERSLAVAIGLTPEHPLYDLFAGCELVDDIASADAGSSNRVSRDGWLLSRDGWLIPPAGNRTAAHLENRRKLRQAEEELQRAENACDAARQQFSESELRLEGQQKTWQQAHIRATDSESALRAGRAAEKRVEEEIESLKRQLSRLQSDQEEAEQERCRWLEQMNAATTTDRQLLVEQEAKLDVQNSLLHRAEQQLEQERSGLAEAEQALALFAQARANLDARADRLKDELTRIDASLQHDRERLQHCMSALEAARDQRDLNQRLATAISAVEAAHKAMNEMRTAGHALLQAQHEAEREERKLRQALQQTIEQRQQIDLEQTRDATRAQDLADEIMQRCQLDPAALLAEVESMENLEEPETILQRSAELEERLERFGPVNLLAIEEFEQASEREAFLADQASDLEASLNTLEATIARIDRTTRQRFREVFDQTNANFKQTFPQLFGGGRAELRLDSDDILSAGVEVIAQPPGKRLQDVTLLSGGEKALTAVALVFSIFKIKPAPFCVLDEVDAPLDDANVGRFADMVRELSDRVQFLAISHNKITMQKSDRLIGVSMPEPGISKIVAVDLAQSGG